MSRSTQFIGLTDKANAFVSKMVIIENTEHAEGMFDEKIPLASYLDVGAKKIYYEVVQCEPWSSGPMIFTCLQEPRSSKQLFKWEKSKTPIQNEFNRKTGKYYI